MRNAGARASRGLDGYARSGAVDVRLGMPSEEIERRIRPFLAAGLVARVPTPWQLVQGTIEMTPYVLSSDATAERRYAGTPFGHPILRQPLIFARVGLDHLRTGPALGAKPGSVCAHLHLTYHQGMPVFDLQVLQTHPDGLARLRARTEELLAGKTVRARRDNRLVALILPRADLYYREFLGTEGWIARAERFDYPSARAEGSSLPEEFFSLTGFLDHCANAFPAAPDAMPWPRRARHVVRLLGRRFREGRRTPLASPDP